MMRVYAIRVILVLTVCAVRPASAATIIADFGPHPSAQDAAGAEEQTDWLNIVTWGRVAENCAQYLDKGSLVGIEGRVQSRTWQTQDGQNRYSVEINARNVQFLESRQEAERRRAGRQERQPSRPTDEPPAGAEDEFGPIPEGEDIFGDQ